MAIGYVCVFASFLLTYLSKAPVALAQYRAGYDNRTPRDQQATLTGLAKRALGAHMNGFEAFGPFAASVIMASMVKVDPAWVMGLAITHLVARLAYVACYLADVGLARSTVWTVGFLATSSLFALSIQRALP